MDMMLLGETISADTDNREYKGFWMAAGGNTGVAAVNVFLLGAANDYEVHLDTKSSDEDDSAAASIGSVTLSSSTPQVFRFEVTDANDLVRYRVKYNGGSSAYVHLQFAQPLWAPN